jgi:CHASE3 domain sensor protein
MKLYLNRKILSGFILSIAVLVSLGVASFLFIRKMTETSRGARTSQQILLSCEYLLALSADLENATLKYAITGEEKFLQSQAENMKLLQKNLAQLNSLTGTASTNGYKNFRVCLARRWIFTGRFPRKTQR